MINLSDRLQRIADNINKGETMADIGTDHGFLPIYLIQKGVSPKVIMSDVSKPSLMKAKQNSDIYIGEAQENIDFRVGDGLSVLKAAEVDVVVIAGMGGKLIRDILSEDTMLTCSFKKFIFQPRIGQGALRRWLLENGFIIIREELVTEGRHIPEIITALAPGTGGGLRHDRINRDFGDEGNEMFYKIPPWIVKAAGPVEEFLTRNIEAEKKKLENVMLSKNRNQELESKICEDIYYLKGLLKEYRNGR